MQISDFLTAARRDASLVDALYTVRHALEIHHGVTVRAEGEEWPLDFAFELQKIDAALQQAGVATAQRASVRRGKA